MFRRRNIAISVAAVVGLFLGTLTSATTASAAPQDVVPINWTQFTGGAPSDTDSLRVINILNNANEYALTTWYNTVKNYDSQTGTYLAFGGTTEAEIRPPVTEGFALAVSLALGAYDPAKTGVSAASAKQIALKLIRSLALQHRANTANGWGNIWQSAPWAAEVGFAGWLLWADLSATDREYVKKMVEYEANRFIGYQVPYYRSASGTINFPGDSKAEENAWNTMNLAVATMMMPNHPNYDAWKYKMVELMVSSYSREGNTTVTSVLLNGHSLADWLYGTNVNANGTLVNHNILHPDYVTSMTAQVFTIFAHAMGGRPTPESVLANLNVGYQSLVDLNFTTGSTAYPPGPPIYAPGGTIYRDGTANIYYPQGNDWGTGRKMNFATLDIEARAFGFDNIVSQNGAYWEPYHAQAALDMQARTTDGHTYITAAEDTYANREEWIADLAANAYFTKWVVNNNAFSLDSSATPTVIDNHDREFSVTAGTWATYSLDAGTLGTDFVYAPTGTGTKSVKWDPRISIAGNYQVYAWWTQAANHATNAQFTVRHDGTNTVVAADQTVNGGKWNLLGTYHFAAGTGGYVSLNDNANGFVVADGVKFVRVP